MHMDMYIYWSSEAVGLCTINIFGYAKMPKHRHLTI